MGYAYISAFTPWNAFPNMMAEAWNYWMDATQRSVLFMDIMRERGNIYLDHQAKGQPPVLIFDYEVIVDGKTLGPASNYSLARIVPPDDVRIGLSKRPVIIIDPRAGHGPGIGGSKRDSEIGMALKGGHPVYFVIFDPDPVPGQTIGDVEQCEIVFIEEVVRRHPDAPKPTVIGNCQAGWALMMLSADRPGTTGPIVLNGSPLSYWAGIEGRDAMRYLGGLLGGTWVNAFLSDLGNGIFDGANLVMNFEMLNWSNTFWKKQYHVYANADTERERYLKFEKWWNAYFHMTKEEIVFIVNNLFIGNKLEKGGLRLNEDRHLDLREIRDPVVVFCSNGDNITPPQQALNWIFQVWGSTGEIKRRQQVIVYVLHQNIGHLGIFVSGKVAQKEHREIIGSYDMIEYLPPGIYEMVIEKEESPSDRESGHVVRFEERRLEHILEMNDQIIQEEESFPLVFEVSDKNYRFYETYISPVVKMAVNPVTAEFLRQLHPLRVTRYGFSDLNPFMFPLKALASLVRENRQPIGPDNLYSEIEKILSGYIAETLTALNFHWAHWSEQKFKSLYDRFFYTDHLFPRLKEHRPSIGDIIEQRRIRRRFKRADREKWMKAMRKGGFKEGLIRVLLAISTADRNLDRAEFEKFENIAKSHPRLRDVRTPEFRKLAREQSRILQTDKYWAIKTLDDLLPKAKDRDEVAKICTDVFQDNGMAEETKRMVRILSMGKNRMDRAELMLLQEQPANVA